jgi:hypothetical protein
MERTSPLRTARNASTFSVWPRPKNPDALVRHATLALRLWDTCYKDRG